MKIVTVSSIAAIMLLVGCSSDRTRIISADRADANLKQTIQSKLDADPALQASGIAVSAHADRNQATLSGTVPSEELRSKAVELAKESNPGLVVTDSIEVKPPEVTRKEYTEDMAREAREKARSLGDKVSTSVDDAWLYTKIEAKLMAARGTSARRVNVDVVNKVVTLRGEVESDAAKNDAGRIAADTEGVRRVNNRLRVQAT